VWQEIDSGREWIVDGDLKDFFGSVDHEKLLTLVAQSVADSRVLRLIKAMLKAGSYGQGKLFPSERGTPQGGVASPLLSNILLTPFDREMRRKGYRLTRFADDWVITCKSAAEARAALVAATRILEQLGVRLNPQKTRIIHVQQGFDFLGYRIVRTGGKSKLPRSMIQRWNRKGLIAYPTRKSIRRFRDRVRMLTRRSAPRKTAQLIKELNPTLRGWAEYYKRAHVRTLFHKLDGWIVRRIWSHRFCRWRSRAWIELPKVKLYEEFGLVNLISLIPSLGSHVRSRASS
jgi:group II intron reverse transcriptase/maturase